MGCGPVSQSQWWGTLGLLRPHTGLSLMGPGLYSSNTQGKGHGEHADGGAVSAWETQR